MRELAKALERTGAKLKGVSEPVETPAPAPAPEKAKPQDSRVGTSNISVHLPKEVRKQLKRSATDRERSLTEVAAEAFNMYFAAYGLPEIAPTKERAKP